jgi:uncharacterized protein YndB with AHSA1/START domain
MRARRSGRRSSIVNDIKAKPGAPEPAGFEFFIRREFDAPLDRMWRAWSDPERMSHWWGPKGSKTEVVKLDFRPGGICHYRMDFEGQTMWGKLRYREIEPKQRLVFIVSFSDENEGITVHPMNPGWPRQILSTITFSEKDGKTTVTVRWVPYEATDPEREVFEVGRDAMQAGWTGTLDRLETDLATA